MLEIRFEVMKRTIKGVVRADVDGIVVNRADAHTMLDTVLDLMGEPREDSST